MQRPVPARSALVVAVIVFFLFLTNSGSLYAADKKTVSGTYTDLHFNEQGGDLLGTELRIVPTRSGYQGVLQFAEGGAGELILVRVDVEGNRIKFVIPESNSYAGTFSGTIADGMLKGRFTFSAGGSEEVVLKRGKSYWD